ncbi:unnamed protein product [Polarella glacialis]|uniref:Uncharacterized protein n=1 Tax=Polarella glacialis TaxID=89957 RepID=A0A813HCM3_POLGL|nr:unnamed protein product [Polarella glacialis]
MGREAFLSAVGAQLLLFGGFTPAGGVWVRDSNAPGTLKERQMRIRPTWKSGGPVDYSLNPAASPEGAIPIFQVATSGGTAVGAGTTVASMAAALEAKGLCGEDFDEEARAAVREMLSWRLPEPEASSGAVTALLAFSFDATPACRNLRDCPFPGPSNELLAASVERFFAENAESPVEVYAQWEIASALLRSGRVPAERIHPAGAAGLYMNTVQILEAMMRDLSQQPALERLAVLAHPDHLRRAYRTVLTHLELVKAVVRPSAVVPAMAPFGLDWPTNPSEGSAVDLFLGSPVTVYSQGRALNTSWRDKNLGYFPDADPQVWVHDREVWILYDHWAMAKGITDGIILPRASLIQLHTVAGSCSRDELVTQWTAVLAELTVSVKGLVAMSPFDEHPPPAQDSAKVFIPHSAIFAVVSFQAAAPSLQRSEHLPTAPICSIMYDKSKLAILDRYFMEALYMPQKPRMRVPKLQALSHYCNAQSVVIITPFSRFCAAVSRPVFSRLTPGRLSVLPVENVRNVWPPERPPTTPRLGLGESAPSPWPPASPALTEPVTATGSAQHASFSPALTEPVTVTGSAQRVGFASYITQTAEFGLSAGSSLAAELRAATGNASGADNGSAALDSPASLIGNVSGLRASETAILLDGLERENTLLRQQLTRCMAREKAKGAEADELREKLQGQESQKQQHHEQESASMAAEGERLRGVVEQQGELAEELAARLEALQESSDAQDARVAALHAELSHAQEDVDTLTRELEKVQRFVLPHAPADLSAETPAPAGSTALQISLHRAHLAANHLRLACEAKFETLGLLHKQLRTRLEAATASRESATATAQLTFQSAGRADRVGSVSDSREIPVEESEAPAVLGPGRTLGKVRAGSASRFPLSRNQGAANSEAAGPAAEADRKAVHDDAIAQLTVELQQARAEVERERARAEEAAQKLAGFDDEQLRSAKDLEAARRALRVREVEVRELQLIGKYFAGREKPPSPQEFGAAELAEELRGRCARLAEELERMRNERDLLRTERDRAERWAQAQGEKSGFSCASEANLDLTGADLALALRILEQKKANYSGISVAS